MRDRLSEEFSDSSILFFCAERYFLVANARYDYCDLIYDCSSYGLVRFYRSRYNKFSELRGEEICEISENASKDCPTLLILSLRICNIDKRQNVLKIFQAQSSLIVKRFTCGKGAQQINNSIIFRHVKNKKRLAQCSVDIERKNKGVIHVQNKLEWSLIK